MATSAKGGDWIAIAALHNSEARSTHGVQPAAGLGSIQLVPFTPGVTALNVFAFWNSRADDVFRAAFQEGKQIGDTAALIAVANDQGILLSQSPGAVAKGTGSPAVKQSAARIDAALRTMLDAMAKGSDPGARNLRGILCLDSIHCARYWDAVASLGREYSFLAASTSIPVAEKVAAAAEGAKDGLRNVGQAAGAALSAAGEGVGIAVGGLFSGLGVMNTAILIGGGVLVAKAVF